MAIDYDYNNDRLMFMNSIKTSEIKHNLMTVKEVADYLRLPKATVYYHAQRGSIPCVKIGGRWRIPRDRLDSDFILSSDSQPSLQSNAEDDKKHLIETIVSEVIKSLSGKL